MAAKRATKKATKKRSSPKRATKKAAAKKSRRGGARPGAGKPPFRPIDAQRWQVECMVAYGLTLAEIAALILNPSTGKSISINTLRKHFASELDAGAAKVHAMLANSIVRKALSKDHPKAHVCAMFVLKCRFGWRETQVNVHETDGVSTGVLVAPAAVDPEAWIKAQEQKNAKKGGPKDEA